MRAIVLTLTAALTGCLWPAFPDPLLRESGAGDATVDGPVDSARPDVAADRVVAHDAPVDARQDVTVTVDAARDVADAPSDGP